MDHEHLRMGPARGARARRGLGLALLVSASFALTGGCIFEPEVVAELSELRSEIKATILSINDAAEQVTRLEARYQEVRTKFKAGTLAENAQLALSLLDEARTEWEQAKINYATLRVHKDELELKVVKIHEKHGVPYWQIVLYAVGVVGSSLLGGRFIQIGGKAGRLLRGLQVLYGAIDANSTGKEREAIKTQVSKADNAEIEKHHVRMKDLEARDPDKKTREIDLQSLERVG